MGKKLLIVLIILAFIFGFLFLYFKRHLTTPNSIKLPEEISTLTPYPTWTPKPGVEKPTITYEAFPFKKNDKTRKVEIFGCVVDNSEWGMSYPKKIVEVPNVTAIATETMKAFLAEAAVSGWGGFPTKNEIERYFNKPGEISLKKLTIDNDGIARVYFSDEVKAYGGGSARVACIHDSTELTLKQFSTIKNVVLCIENVCSDQKGSTIFQP